MNEDILKFISKYKVLLCTLCVEPHCVPLTSIAWHFLHYHADSVSQRKRKSLVQYARTFKDELADPNEVKTIVPPFEDGPIVGIHKLYRYHCTVCEQLLAAEISMKDHCRGHGWKAKDPEIWTRKWMQVFSTSKESVNKLDFFCCSSIPELFPH